MKTICVFAIHRTGSSYLRSVLRQWPALAAFGELFHATQPFGLQAAHMKAASKAAGAAYDDPADPAFVAWARAHPLALVEALRRVAARKDKAAVFFKVFPGQWTADVPATIAAFARADGFVPVILQRRCIDVYVSYRKAEATGGYQRLDTTDRPVALDPAAYAHWAERQRAWYATVDAALARAGVVPIRLTYERDIDLAPAALAAHWSALLGVPAPDGVDDAAVLARQDRSARLEDKISNHDAFDAALRERGLWDESRGHFLPT